MIQNTTVTLDSGYAAKNITYPNKGTVPFITFIFTTAVISNLNQRNISYNVYQATTTSATLRVVAEGLSDTLNISILIIWP